MVYFKSRTCKFRDSTRGSGERSSRDSRQKLANGGSNLPGAIAGLRCSSLLPTLCWLVSGPAWADCPQFIPDSPDIPALVTRYAGSYDTDALLREPFVSGSLDTLLGPKKQHFMANLDVRGSVDLVSGVLSLAGNAVHHGGEEEAVLCLEPRNCAVSAALLSEGVITVYSSSPDYDGQNLCIKDWITQVNSAHRDRLWKPDNVQVKQGP